MAGCYHDQEDFLSDMKIEVAKEDEIVEEGQDLADITCKKNPGHKGFIPFKDVKLEDLPEEDRTMENLKALKSRGNIVVRILVDKMENGERKTYCGTGYVVTTANQYFIRTNNHLVKTNEDVKNCTVEFFYDSHDRSKVIKSRGVKLCFTCPYKDVTLFVIHPVHDSIKQLNMVPIDSFMPYIVLCNNKIPFMTKITRPAIPSSKLNYTDANINDPRIEIMFLWFWDKSFGYLKSSYFRFQPIPSNIQDITNIEIHVDEDDGNSTVISGDVVKFDDEYVVKISESIFQDKAKKCRLVLNGEVISRGTRLYFQRMKFSEFYSKSDLEKRFKYLHNPSKDICFFDFSPKDNYLETFDFDSKCLSNMYCIGHPHGGIKMVTFGLFLVIPMDTTERRKQTKFMQYSCKTCPGSSGSSVFPSDGLVYNIGPSHFMGKSVEGFLKDGQYIENINTACLG